MQREFSLFGQQDGFTFNEILVAISLIVIAILGYSLTTTGVIRGNQTSNNLTVAVNLAQDKMEQLKGEKTLHNVNRCPSGGDQNISATGGPGGIYQRCWTVTDSPFAKNLKQIDVTVFWQDYENREITISTLVFKG
jgi:type II secretory pathway pseudopilin PulG